jgi:hypothetical protein
MNSPKSSPSERFMPTRLAALVLALCGSAALADPDPASLYEISTESAPAALKVGEKGKLTLEIRSRPGAHVSDQAPLRLELSGKNVKPDKEKLTLADSLGKKAAGQEYANPRFEIPFAGATAGKGSLDAKLTFFICTEKVCARQQKTFNFPVEVQ